MKPWNIKLVKTMIYIYIFYFKPIEIFIINNFNYIFYRKGSQLPT